MNNKRILVLAGVVFLLTSIIIWRLFSIQIQSHDFYLALAHGQHKLYQQLVPQRGSIITSDNYVLALNKEWPMVYAVPREIHEPEQTAKALAVLLDIDEEVIKKRLSKRDDPYEPLKNKISNKTQQEIENLNLPGIKIGFETKRYYPGDSLAANLLGFVSSSGGQYGLEEYYNKQLSGTGGFLKGQKDALGSLTAKQNFKPAIDGSDLNLTIDRTVQFFIETKLAELVEKYQAFGGSIIVMEPVSGAILGLANYPSFDPNHYSDVENMDVFLNRTIHHVFEPGSVFKPITIAAALDKNAITPETTYLDKGVRYIDGHDINNWDLKAHGKQTMTQVLEKSLNTGAIFAGEQLGKEDFLHYIKKFGFDVSTGIGLVGERKGDISNLLLSKRDINYATASFGQGISITPLQLITAINAIANNGRLMQPHIVKQKPKMIRSVVSAQTALQLTQMLVSVFEAQPLKKAQITNYQIAGKTGTAQIAVPGGYSETEFIHTLIGYAPAYDPKFILLIKLDKPVGVRWAAVSLSSAFHDIAEFLFNYFQIPPHITE